MPGFLRATNDSKGALLASKVKPATGFLSRSIGLLGRDGLAGDEGLWITPCNSVHTFFMRFSIDVAFLDKEGKVISQTTLRPWRLSRLVFSATGALELPAGTLERTGTQPGDRITFKAN